MNGLPYWTWGAWLDQRESKWHFLSLQQVLESRMMDMIGDGTLPCAAGQDSGCGQVKLSLSYDSRDKQLSVMVHSCRCVGGVPVACYRPPTALLLAQQNAAKSQ